MTSTINPRSGTAFELKKGQLLKVIDPRGEQVSDLICYNMHDKREYLSSGRTFDYGGNLFLTAGNDFYSNRSNVMFRMIEDTVGRHDFLYTPCSADTFRITYGHERPHRGCYGNLCAALKDFGIGPDEVGQTFNIFMNVLVDGETGKISVHTPRSKSGDYVIIRAEMDLIVGLTACSAEKSNNYEFKPIEFEVLEA
jgi:uncharacterized protein